MPSRYPMGGRGNLLWEKGADANAMNISTFAKLSRKERKMRLLMGVIVGVVLTIGAAFVADAFVTSDIRESPSRQMVNWDVAKGEASRLHYNSPRWVEQARKSD
jgi:hypothetical protein